MLFLKEKNRHIKNKIISIMIAFLVAFFFLWNFSIINEEQRKVATEENRLLAIQELTVYSDRIQHIINTNLQYTDFIELLITNDPQISDETLGEYADYIIRKNSMIKSIFLAPNGVVTTVFPNEGSEKDLEHPLLTHKDESTFIMEGIELKQSVVQGPMKTRQGESLIFNRKAIFVNDNNSFNPEEKNLNPKTEKFWGISIISIDFNEIIKEIGFLPEKDGYLMALRAKKIYGENDFIWGRYDIFSKDSIKKTIMFFNQEWELAIYPQKGWEGSKHLSDNLEVFFYIMTGIVFGIVYFLINNYQNKIQLSRKEPLTGTLNKNAFQAYVEKKFANKKKKHGICVIDLNNFKEVNDTYGHPIGDAVLIEIAKRIKKVLRDTDRVSRFGGDEYLLFINDIEGEEFLQQILERIIKEIEKPIFINKLEIKIGFSLGYALFPDDGVGYKELYTVGDKRMYDSKLLCKS